MKLILTVAAITAGSVFLVNTLSKNGGMAAKIFRGM